MGHADVTKAAIATATQALAAKDAEIERLKGTNEFIGKANMDGARRIFRLEDDIAAKDARIAQLEEAVRVLGEVQENARRYVYESSRFEPDNTYQAKLKAAVDAFLANPVAAKAVEP